MDNVVVVCIALSIIFILVRINTMFRKKSIAKIVYSQSSIHNAVKDIIPKAIFEKPKPITQSSKHTDRHMIKVIVIDNIAYWVKDNIFYTAKTKNGNVVDETAEPVNIENMPKKELDKMLFILDNLNRGKDNDSSGTGNQ